MLEIEEQRQRAEEQSSASEFFTETRDRVPRPANYSSAFDIDEAQKTIRESIQSQSNTILGRDHSMFDESIDFTPTQHLTTKFMFNGQSLNTKSSKDVLTLSSQPDA